MGDYNLSEDEATLMKHLLTNITSAVCQRLDAIDEQLDSISINTWYIEHRIDQLWPSDDVAEQLQKDCQRRDSNDLALMDLLSSVNVDKSVNIITLNTEDDYPDGSWIGDFDNPIKRVRVPISTSDLAHIHANCQTAVKMALTMLDYLFDRDTQAMSNLSGTGKHCKQQLDPLMIYGIQCHLEKWFNISSDEWYQIRLNMDSKCRSAYRRKVLGLPLSVKAFRCRGPPPNYGSTQSVDNLLDEGISSSLTTQEAEEEICVDDGVKIGEVCLTESQLNSLTENHIVSSLSYRDGNSIQSDGTMHYVLSHQCMK